MLGVGVGWVAVPGNGAGFVGMADAAQIPVIDEIKKQKQEAAMQRQLAEQARAEAEHARAAALQARDMAERALDVRKVAEAKLAAALAQLRQVQAETDQQMARNADLRSQLQMWEAQGKSKAQTELFQKLKNEMIQLRMKLAEEEERFRAIERDNSADLERLRSAISDKHREADRIKLELGELLEKVGQDNPVVAKRKAILQEQLQLAERLKEEMKDRQAKGMAERLNARKTMVHLEEEAKLIERQFGAGERESSADRTALQDRLRGSATAADGRLADIEKKLDLLVRELAELRRELKK
jgi:hypothetical protein